ncbi:hypothetical protein Tco_1042035 [Tanacetum coccineum]|uniref:Uncharacterized protein n=1 Tax=Tanacetum coccineum TaxID=301880 RepID=A0ABQ5GIF0_9ASTR
MTGKKVYPSIILLSDAALAKPGHVGPSSAHQSVILPYADDVGKGAAPARTAEGARANKDDASFLTMGDEIEKKLFPLVPGPYYMPYPYAEGQSSESSRVSQNGGYVSARVVQPDECLDCPHEVKKLRDQLAKDEGAFARAAESKTYKYKDMAADGEERIKASISVLLYEKILRSAKNTLDEVASLQLEKLTPCVPTVHASSSAYATSSSQKTFGHTSAQSASKFKKATQVEAHSGREFIAYVNRLFVHLLFECKYYDI